MRIITSHDKFKVPYGVSQPGFPGVSRLHNCGVWCHCSLSQKTLARKLLSFIRDDSHYFF